MTKPFRDAIRELLNQPSSVLSRSDKVPGSVLLNRDDYEEKILGILGGDSKSTCKPNENDKTTEADCKKTEILK